MKLFKKQAKTLNSTDADLVIACLGGDRDAFGFIVARYQSLLCSLAYSSLGDLKHSEDVAQETFIEAWKKMASLNDPEKLKAWLCGILRFKVSHHQRSENRHGLKHAVDIDENSLADTTASEERVEDIAIEEQKQALMWQTLEKLPGNYREPLILFYREHCSVERVAEELDLNLDTAKQRLSRGRKMLQDAMVGYIEDALAKSKPSAGFTAAVLLAIVNIPAPAQAAGLGAGVFKAGSTFKWSSLVILLASFSGVIASFFSLRANLDQSRTDAERRRVIKVTVLFFAIAAVYVAGMLLLKGIAAGAQEAVYSIAIGAQLLAFSFVIAYLWLITAYVLQSGKFRASQRQRYPEAFQNPADSPNSKSREIRTRTTLFGLPLVHFKLGASEQDEAPAFGWIAGGDRAYGVLFAWGGLAVAPVSVGIASVGILSIGAVSLGVFSIGTVALGVIGFGASAIAYKAYSSLSSLGWESAMSGSFAIAKDAALAPYPFAAEVNNELAAKITHLSLFSDSYVWVLAGMTVLVIAPAVWYAKKVRERLGIHRV